MTASVRERLGTFADDVAVPWSAVAVLAAVMSFADGFWLISLRDAIGAVERINRPFTSWLVDSTVVLPLFALAVLGALAVAYKRYGPVLRRGRQVVTAALLIAAAGTLAALVVAVASSAYDYHFQSSRLEQAGSQHVHPIGSATCNASCAEELQTLEAHARGIGYAVPVLLTTNVLLVGWVVGMRGGRLDAPVVRRKEPATV